MLKRRSVQERRGWAFSTVVGIVKPSFRLLTKAEWIDGMKIPAKGGFVMVANHISHVDPLVLGLFVYDHGRIVRYLAKQEIFETPVLKTIARDARQIPVARLSTDAATAFAAAVEAVEAGECVTFYPEGTLTRDPDLWPMTGKTGAARVALATGCPVIPVGQWGAQNVLAPYGSKPKVFPPQVVRCKAGDPVDLGDLVDKPMTNDVLREATERIMAAITELVEDLRGETAPVERYDPRKSGVKQTGNPNQKKRKRGRR